MNPYRLWSEEAKLSVKCESRTLFRSYQVRGHLAANIDPLGLNNMDKEAAKKMINRSVTIDDKVYSSLRILLAIET